MKYIGALDQGTTSTRFIIFDDKNTIVASSQMEHRQIYPKPGWVEHDVEEIWKNTKKVITNALEKAGLKLGSVTTEHSDTIKEGRVISQSVNAGKTVEKGTKVNIVISLGKKVEYYQFTNQYSFAGATKATYTLKLSDGSKRTKTVNVVGGRITVSEYDLTSSSGTLVIVWTYTDDEGNEATETEEIGLVKFTKQ